MNKENPVKSFDEAALAIKNIVENAKIPVVFMVAILEAEKFSLLCKMTRASSPSHTKKINMEDFVKIFEKESHKIMKNMEKTHSKGVS